MLRVVIVGVWGVLAALLGAYFVHDLVMPNADAANDSEHASVLEQVKTELTGVPIIVSNEVQGYIVVSISSMIDTSLLPSKNISVIPFLTDAAFRASYEFAENGFVKIRASDIESVSAKIKEIANQDLKNPVIQSVSVEQFNFVRRDEIRGSMMKSN